MRSCITCKNGEHQPSGDPKFPWSPCGTCGARALLDAQMRDLGLILGQAGQAIVAACMGYGKTPLGVAVANELRGVWLIVAPKGTREQWAAAAREWAPDATVHVMGAENKTGLIDLKESDKDGFSIHIVGWEYFRMQDLSRFRNIAGVIADEVHRAAGIKSASARALFRIDSKYRIALSGTWTRNKLIGAFNPLHWIWGVGQRTAQKRLRFQYFGQWRDRNFITEIKEEEYLRSGRKIPEHVEIIGEKFVGSVVSEIPLYIQHLEWERCCEFHPNGVNADLPIPEAPQTIYVDMLPAQRKMYDKTIDKKQLTVWAKAYGVGLEEGERASQFEPVIVTGLSERLRAMQISLAVPSVDMTAPVRYHAVTGEIVPPPLLMEPDAKSATADALVDLCSREVDDDEPMIVYTHSKAFVKLAVPRLVKAGIKAVEWSGDIKAADRDRIRKETFGRPGGPNVIVAVIKSIAEGTDGLQEVCRTETWVSLEDDMMLNSQGVGRLLRRGQKRHVRRFDIIARDSIQETQRKVLWENKLMLDNALRAR